MRRPLVTVNCGDRPQKDYFLRSSDVLLGDEHRELLFAWAFLDYENTQC